MLFSSGNSKIFDVEAKDSIFKPIDIEHIVRTIELEGFFQGFELPESYVNEIVDFAKNNDYYAHGNLNHGFKYDRHSEIESICQFSVMRGEYINTFDSCPAIQQICQDWQIVRIANRYLKTQAVLMNTRLWWNFVVNEDNCDLKKAERMFHYDPDDYRCLAFAFYIFLH